MRDLSSTSHEPPTHDREHRRMWWRILVALVLTLPPVAYVAGALANDEQHRDPHPTVVLNTGGTDDDTERDRPGRGDGQGKKPGKRDDRGNDERPGEVTVVRPGPVAVGDDGGDDDDDDGDDGDDTDDTDDD
jgi:hypothetical protein